MMMLVQGWVELLAWGYMSSITCLLTCLGLHEFHYNACGDGLAVVAEHEPGEGAGVLVAFHTDGRGQHHVHHCRLPFSEEAWLRLQLLPCRFVHQCYERHDLPCHLGALRMKFDGCSWDYVSGLSSILSFVFCLWLLV